MSGPQEQQGPGQGPEQQWQPPAYTPSQYPQYEQPNPGGQTYPPAPQYPSVPPGYPQPDQYGQQPAAYAQPGQYGPPAQYGQYPQQPGQYGQPVQYGQYPQQPQPGQYGQPEPAGKRPTALIGAVAAAFLGVVALVVLVLGFWKPGFFVTTRLDIDKAQAGVQQILSDQTNGYGAKNVKDVKCNDGQSPVVKKGDTFNCEVSIDGTKRQVTVTFQDSVGTYEVGRPK